MQTDAAPGRNSSAPFRRVCICSGVSTSRQENYFRDSEQFCSGKCHPESFWLWFIGAFAVQLRTGKEGVLSFPFWEAPGYLCSQQGTICLAKRGFCGSDPSRLCWGCGKYPAAPRRQIGPSTGSCGLDIPAAQGTNHSMTRKSSRDTVQCGELQSQVLRLCFWAGSL